jgi:hypothetical protein
MIVIVGDSWGVGEWASDTNSMYISGPGIGQILNYNLMRLSMLNYQLLIVLAIQTHVRRGASMVKNMK